MKLPFRRVLYTKKKIITWLVFLPAIKPNFPGSGISSGGNIKLLNKVEDKLSKKHDSQVTFFSECKCF
jgi:hypothetical protein